MTYVCNKRILKQRKLEDFECRLAAKSAELLTLSGEEYHNCYKEREQMLESFDNVFKSDWKEYFIGRMVHCKEQSSEWFFRRIPCIAGSLEMLNNEEGEEVTDNEGILDICCSFYEKLFTDKDVQACDDAATSIYDDSIGNISFSDRISTIPYSDTEDNVQVHDEPYAFLLDDSSLRLLPEDQQYLGTVLTCEEFRVTLVGMKDNKAPGLDGIPAEFYKEFFDTVGQCMFDSLTFAYEHGELSTSQKHGIIKLIPKKNKDPHHISNLRPITLLNVDVKIVSRALAHRLQSVISRIIPTNQRAFIKGRYIGENVLDVYSLIAVAEAQEEEDVLIFLDIEKAYDTVKWRFLDSVLMKLGFPDYFIRWVHILHKNKEIRFYNNGFSSRPLFPSKGLAQGCGLSPLLFIIVMACLGQTIDNYPMLVGVKVGTYEKRYGMAADDTIISLRGSFQCLLELRNILMAFYDTSGLQVNFNKSVIIGIGARKHLEGCVAGLEDFLWCNPTESVKYLGISVGGSTTAVDHHFLIDRVFVQ